MSLFDDHHTWAVKLVPFRHARGYGFDVDDLRQEALLGLLEAEKKYDPKKYASFRTFARGVISRRVVDAVRRHVGRRANTRRRIRPQALRADSPLLCSREGLPGRELEEEELITYALAGLSERSQNIVRGYLFSGKTMAQIATEIGTTESEISRNFPYILRVVRSRLEGTLGWRRCSKTTTR